jgi:hypothetical protein
MLLKTCWKIIFPQVTCSQHDHPIGNSSRSFLERLTHFSRQPTIIFSYSVAATAGAMTSTKAPGRLLSAGGFGCKIQSKSTNKDNRSTGMLGTS